MSVIGYSREEVVSALAAAWTRGSIGSSDNLRYMGLMAEFGNQVLEANGKAYAHTYNETVDPESPIAAADIKREIIRDSVEIRRRGLNVLRGLRYNLVANDGTDFATADILDWLLTLFMGLCDRAERRAA